MHAHTNIGRQTLTGTSCVLIGHAADVYAMSSYTSGRKKTEYANVL